MFVKYRKEFIISPHVRTCCLVIKGTGLFRDQNQVFTKVFDVAATNLLKVGETTHWGGGALEYMVCSVCFVCNVMSHALQ